MNSTTFGRIDVHSHLLPGIDDGCQSIEDSIICAKQLVAAGYSHSFCTPHIWPNLPDNTMEKIVERTRRMQELFDQAKVPLKLIPGGEQNLRPAFTQEPGESLVTYGMQRRYVLADFWAEKLPDFFEPCVRWIQSQHMTMILAHPERMRAVQEDPSLADLFADMGVLLQGNLQCFGDPPHADTRRVAEQYLSEGRYFMLGSDLHNSASLPIRLKGLARVVEAVGEEASLVLTRDHPMKLLPEAMRVTGWSI